jgi:hypothetical protein
MDNMSNETRIFLIIVIVSLMVWYFKRRKGGQSMDEERPSVPASSTATILPNKQLPKNYHAAACAVKPLYRIEGFAFIFFKNFFITFWSYFLIYNVWWLLGMVKGQWPIETSIIALFKSGGAGTIIGLLYSIYEARKPKEISEGRFIISKKNRILCYMGVFTFVTWIWAIVVFSMIASRS